MAGGMYNTGANRGQANTRQNNSKSVKSKMKQKQNNTTPTTRPRTNPTTGNNNSNKGNNCCGGSGSRSTNPSQSSTTSTFSKGGSIAVAPGINTSLNNNTPAINNASTGNNTMQGGMKATYTTGNAGMNAVVQQIQKTTTVNTSSSHSYMSYGSNNIGQWASAANALGSLGAKYNIPFSNALQSVGSGPFTNSGLNSTFNNMMSIGVQGGASVGGLAHANVAVFQSAIGNVNVNIFGSVGRATKHTTTTNMSLTTTTNYTLTHNPIGPGTGKNGGASNPSMSNYSQSHQFSSSSSTSSQHHNNWMIGVSANTNNASGLNVGIAVGTGQVHTTAGAQSNTMVSGAITYNFKNYNLGGALYNAVSSIF